MPRILKSTLLERLKYTYQEGGLHHLLDFAKQKIALETSRTLRHSWLLDFFQPKLRSAHVELTNVCNLRCEMCYSNKRPKGFMETKLFKRVVDELAALQVQALSLHYGGESLLHPNFPELLEYATNHNLTVGWYDNGMLFTEEITDLTVELGVDEVVFSLDGLGKVNDDIRKGAKYEVIEQNILMLLRKRGLAGKPRVIIHMTDVGQGSDELKRCVDYWVPKVDFVTVSPCLNSRYQIIRPRKYFGDYPTRQNRMCYSPFSYLAILWNGDVTPCCHDLEGALVMGNVAETNVKSVWTNQKYRDLRKVCLTGNFPRDSICFACNAWKTSFVPSINREGDLTVTSQGSSKQYSH